MTTEVWKVIPGHPLYEVSDLGRVRSLPRRGTKGGIKKQTLLNTGYLQVGLDNNKKYSVHRLVCENFHPNPNNLPIVRHLDNNPHNNHKDNLCWGTQQDNIVQCVREGRRKGIVNNPKGNNQYMSH